MGSNWFCPAVPVVNASSLEMQIGVASVAFVSLLVVWTIMRLVRNARA